MLKFGERVQMLVFVNFLIQPLFRSQIGKPVKSDQREGAPPCTAHWATVHCVQSRLAWFGLRIRAGSRPHLIRESKVHCLTLHLALWYRIWVLGLTAGPELFSFVKWHNNPKYGNLWRKKSPKKSWPLSDVSAGINCCRIYTVKSKFNTCSCNERTYWRSADSRLLVSKWPDF